MESEGREELERLIEEQERDLKHPNLQEPQRFGGSRTAPMEKFVGGGRDSEHLDSVRGRTDGGSARAVSDAAAPRPAWRGNRVHVIHRPRLNVRQQQTISDAFVPALGSLTNAQHDAVRLVVYKGLSQREAADALGIKQPPLFRLLKRAFHALRKWFEAKYIPSDAELAVEWTGRDLDERPPTPCRHAGCITILSRFNPYADECWTHATAPTRAQLVRAEIVGAA